MKQIKIYGDTGDLNQLKKLVDNPIIEGFTTNPSLMQKGGVKNYKLFAYEAIKIIKEKKPYSNISLEVFADNPVDMEKQARTIASWSRELDFKIYVKVPIINIDGKLLTDLLTNLSNFSSGTAVRLNVTCIMNVEQFDRASEALQGNDHILSIFAGRIADTHEDAEDLVYDCKSHNNNPGKRIQKLWASPRQLWDIVQAERSGCDIITLFPELIAKLPNIGRHLRLVSIDTSKMFFDAAKESGFSI